MYADYRDKGFIVLGLNRSDDKKIAEEFLNEDSATFPTVLDSSPAAWKACAGYETLGGMSGVPLNYIIDREGKVADAWYGSDTDRGIRVLGTLGMK